MATKYEQRPIRDIKEEYEKFLGDLSQYEIQEVFFEEDAPVFSEEMARSNAVDYDKLDGRMKIKFNKSLKEKNFKQAFLFNLKMGAKATSEKDLEIVKLAERIIGMLNLKRMMSIYYGRTVERSIRKLNYNNLEEHDLELAVKIALECYDYKYEIEYVPFIKEIDEIDLEKEIDHWPIPYVTYIQFDRVLHDRLYREIFREDINKLAGRKTFEQPKDSDEIYRRYKEDDSQ